MIWFFIFGLAYYSAFRGQQTQKLLNGSPDHPLAFKLEALVGLYYFAATLLLMLFPFMLRNFTDNFIPDAVSALGLGLLILALIAEIKGNIQLANKYVRNGFYAMIISIVVMSFAVPEEEYNFPESLQETTLENK